MSPLLFNFALDPLIQKLENEGRGFVTDSEPITAMAFADDLVILSSSLEGMSHNLAILERFSELTGMQVQPGKCHSFFIDASGGSVAINNCPPWRLAGRPIHMIGPTESVRYLGIEVNPWRGIFSRDWVAQAKNCTQVIGSAPLDPIDKVSLLCDYALPRLIFGADHCMATVKTLTEVDGIVN